MNNESIRRIRKKYIWLFVLITALSMASAFLSAFPLQILKNIIDELMLKEQGGSSNSQIITKFLTLSLTYILCLLTSYILNNLRTYISSLVKIKISNDIRNMIFNHLILLNQQYFDQANSSELLGIVMQDSDFIASGIVSPITNIGRVAFSFIFGIYFMSTINVLLTIIIIPITIIVGIISSLSTGRLKILAKENRRRNTILWDYTTESISGIRDIRSVGKETNTSESFYAKSISMYENENSTEKYKFKVEAINNICLIILLCAALITGGYLAINNIITLGSLVAILTYNSLLTQPIQSFVLVFQDLSRAKASKERSNKILMVEIDKSYFYTETIVIKDTDLAIKFSDVGFNYNSNREIFESLDFSINKNTITAFVGDTGSGKSTILKLLNTIYDTNKGEIFIYDQMITYKNKISSRKLLSYAFQETYLFNGTIIENILFSNESAEKDAIDKALTSACIYEMVSKFPLGLETIVGENGLLLSGGERQRIGIARMLIKEADIFLLDEATSSLDNNTEKNIMNNILKSYPNKTLLIIAHRLSTIVNADKIFVISNGKIIESGTHLSLMSYDSKYKQLYNANKLKQLQ